MGNTRPENARPGNENAAEHLQRSKRVGQALDLAKLSPGQLQRLNRIKGDLTTPEGRLDAMNTLAANSFDLEQWGIAWLRAKSESDGVLVAYESSMLNRHISIHNAARADIVALENMAREQARHPRQTLDELLKGNPHDEPTD